MLRKNEIVDQFWLLRHILYKYLCSIRQTDKKLFEKNLKSDVTLQCLLAQHLIIQTVHVFEEVFNLQQNPLPVCVSGWPPYLAALHVTLCDPLHSVFRLSRQEVTNAWFRKDNFLQFPISPHNLKAQMTLIFKCIVHKLCCTSISDVDLA